MSQFFPSLDKSSHKSKSTVESSSELANNGYIGKELANSEINVLSAMQAGTNLLKLCSRRTRAHWRKFQLDASNTKIKWVSDKKDVNDTTIYIGHIIEIICHSLEIVKKFKDTLPEELVDNYESLQQQQFTIRYMEHNKNLANYLPQISPNHSLSNLNVVTPNMHPNNANNNSSSFIRSLRNNAKQITLVQPEYHYMDESVTESSSHHHNVGNNNKKKDNGTSFWKSLLNKNKKNSKNNKNKKQKQMEQSKEYMQYDDERNDSDNLQLQNNYYKHYHVSELHLMAEKCDIATIWIYGLERLMELNSLGVDLSLIPRSQFKISSKELMNYSKNKGYNYYKSSEELSSFKLHLDEINDALYNIIQQMPSSQRDLLMEPEEHKSNENNYLIKKIRQDKNDLDYILHQVSKARFDVNNVKRWSYILTRIEINIGAYQIALNNQKYVNNDTNKHERKISQSSSANYHSKSPFTLQQQHSNSIAKYQRNAILKNRSPRSPNYNNIVQSPKYDSV